MTTFRMIFLTTVVVLTLSVGTVLLILCSILTLGLAKNWITRSFSRGLGRLILFFAGVKVHFVGGPIASPAVYISNHSSTLDIFLIMVMGLPKVRYIAKHELLYNPLFGIMGWLTGQIFIKRQDSVRAVATLNRAYKKIRRQGLSLYVAPEGTRIVGGQIGPFKKGAFRMALDLQYPIVPVHFAGARRLCPGKTLRVQPGEVTIHFYPAHDTNGWTRETLNAQVNKIREDYIQWEAEYDKLAIAT